MVFLVACVGGPVSLSDDNDEASSMKCSANSIWYMSSWSRERMSAMWIFFVFGIDRSSHSLHQRSTLDFIRFWLCDWEQVLI